MEEPKIQPEEENPLLFWVAYLPAANGKCNYLSDGKGNLRVFRTEQGMRDYLEPLMPADIYATVVVHSVQGTIIVPYDNYSMPMDQIPDGSLHYSKPESFKFKPLRKPLLPPLGANIIPFDMMNMKPAITTAPATHPTSLEQLQNLEQRRKKARKRRK